MSQLFHPNGPALDPAHAAAKQGLGRVSCYPHLLPHEEETLSGGGTVGGAYPLLSSCHTPLPSPFQYWKRNLGSKVRLAPACLNMQNAHTALPERWG